MSELELLEGLKPCPFCGRHSTIIRSEQVSASGMTLYAVRCYRCGADGPKVYSYGGDDQNLAKETAAVFWNGRASDEGDDRLRAQKEGHPTLSD